MICPHCHKEFSVVPEKRKVKSDFTLPGWIDPEVWQGFEEMRQKIRSPLTNRARNMTVNQLEIFRAQGHDPNAVLDESTRMGWRGVFLPRAGKQNALEVRNRKIAEEFPDDLD